MLNVIELFPKDKPAFSISNRFKAILEKRKKGVITSLTPENLRNRPGLEGLNDDEAKQIVQTIQDLASLFFEIACLKDTTCIDNQHVVSLNQEKKAA